MRVQFLRRASSMCVPDAYDDHNLFYVPEARFARGPARKRWDPEGTWAARPVGTAGCPTLACRWLGFSLERSSAR